MDILQVIERETGQAVTEDTPLDELHVDSLEFIDLTLTISAETGKYIPDEKLSGLHTVGDLVREFA
jgi:acyl carrier protein